MTTRDWAWIEAAREVDELAPAAPPIYVEDPRGNRIPSPPALPRGWRYRPETDTYVDPRGGCVEGMFIRAMRPHEQERFWAQQAADLADVLNMAAKTRP